MSVEPVTVERLRPFASTIFSEMTELAVRHDAVNLGQGAPDTDGPAGMLEAARQAITDGFNQYPPGRGVAELRHAIAADRARRYGISYDPDREILVTFGATEAVSAAVLGLVEPGAEVVLIEPYYDSYPAAVAMAGARRRTARLVPDGHRFVLDHDSLRAAITPATRMLIMNSPHNPTGTVLGRDDLAAISEIACAHDLLVLTDEVYEHFVYDEAEHLGIAGFPGMAERTLTVSGAAKSFNVTGWKTGWVCGPAALIDAVNTAKQFMTFTGNAPFQPAIAHALTHDMDWVAAKCATLSEERLRLSEALSDTGFGVYSTTGSYFVCADIRPLGETDGMSFCRKLPERAGVAAIPVGVFTDDPAAWRHIVRFAFCKRPETVDEGIRRLRTAFQR